MSNYEAKTSVSEAIKERKRRKVDNKREVVPPQPKPPMYEAALERELQLAHLAMGQYEKMLNMGQALSPEDMRLFMSLLNTIRQLEVSLQALKDRKKDQQMGPVEVAIGLLETGMSKEDVKALYPDNKKVSKAVDQYDNPTGD